LANNQKEKIFSNKVVQNFLENDPKFTLKNKYKFAEIASSLAYYLKSFSNINKLLDYVCLIFKHIFSENIILIIPLNYEGEIWNENIKISVNYEYSTIQEAINSFLDQFHFSKNFKIKEIVTFENALKNKFKEYKIEAKKIISRGKCRGFIYIFSEDISRQSITEDSNFNFIENCLAVGLENYYLIKTKKKHENVDREISTGAEIQSQLLPDYCPIIYGIDLAAHCRPALQLGGDYYDFMCLKTNISEKRKEKSRWAFVIGDVMGKGIPAGLLMTMLRGMLRAEVLTGLPPDRILHDLNQLAINDLDQSHRFVTLFYSDYDPRTRKLRFANAAHNPPLLWKSSDQKIIKLDAKGFVLGLQKDAEYHCGEIKLNQNDLVLYYTDGVIDTSNSLGQRFDEERLIKTLTKLCKQSYTSQEILNKIFKKLDDFTGQNRHLEDDASMVIFQLK
jgi:sigma-B regulation protein RsbU (phosphoserine phosphatase)